jgi:hypothetical protein
MVQNLIAHDLLMQLAVGASLIKHRVFPAVWIVASLLFRASVVLPEVNLLHRCNLLANGHSEVFIGDAPIAICVKPC